MSTCTLGHECIQNKERIIRNATNEEGSCWNQLWVVENANRRRHKGQVATDWLSNLGQIQKVTLRWMGGREGRGLEVGGKGGRRGTERIQDSGRREGRDEGTGEGRTGGGRGEREGGGGRRWETEGTGW